MSKPTGKPGTTPIKKPAESPRSPSTGGSKPQQPMPPVPK